MKRITKGLVALLLVCSTLFQAKTTQGATTGSDFALRTGPGTFFRTLNFTADLTPGKSLTLELWFKAQGPGVLINEVDSFNVSFWDYSFLEINSANELIMGLPGIVGSASLGSVVNGKWYHVAIRYDETTHAYDGFVNGTKKGSLTGPRSVPAEAGRQAYYAFGRQATFNNLTGAGFFSGDIDEVRLWSSVRSDLDISNSYRSSIGTIATGLVLNWHLNDGSGDFIADASGGAHQGLNVGAAWTPSDLRLRTSKKDVGAGIPDFAIATGSGTFFRTENFTANLTGSTFTIELWFKPQGSGVLVNEVDSFDVSFWDYSLLEINSANNLIMGLPGITGSASLGSVTTGEWTHVALRYDASLQEYAGFVNGVKKGSLTGVRNLPASIGRVAYFAFGRAATFGNLTGAGFFNGPIDEVRLWQSARSDRDINSAWNNTIGGPATFLVFNWHLNEGGGSFIGDSAGLGNAGLNVGAQWVASDLQLREAKVAKALSDFALGTGPNSYFRTENVTAFLTPSGTFTIELWFKPHGPGVLVNEVDAFDVSFWDYSLLEIDSNNNLIMGLPGVAGSASLGQATIDKWQHVAIRYDAVAHVYDGFVNGIKTGSLTGVKTQPWEIFRWAYFSFGRAATFNNLSGAGFFNGAIDEVRVWQLPRSDQDIRSDWNSSIGGPATGLAMNWHLNEGGGTFLSDTSGFGNSGLNVSAFWVFSDLRVHKAKLPKPTSDWAMHTFPGGFFRTENFTQDLTPEKTFTMELWFKPAGSGVLVNEVDSFIIGLWDYSFLEIDSTGQLILKMPGIAGSAALGQVTNGKWQHAAIRYNAATQTYDGFLNGVKTGSLTGNRFAPWEAGRPAYFAFGRNATLSGGGYFTGDIDEVRLWQNARSDQDIATSWTKTIAGATTGLILNWHLNEGAGSFIGDSSSALSPGLLVGAGWTPSDLKLQKSKLTPPPAVNYALRTSQDVFYRTESFTATLTPDKTMTIELWFKAQGSGVIVNEVDAFDVSFWDYSLAELTSAGELLIGLPGIASSASLGTVPFGVWNHLAIRYDAVTQTYSGFVNGVKKATVNGVRATPWEVGRVAYFAFGRNATVGTLAGGCFFNGDTDELRIWQTAVSDSDIRANYRKGVSETATGVVLNWHLDEGVGTFISDASANGNTGLNVGAAWVLSDRN